MRTGGQPRARSVNDVKTGYSRSISKRQIQILINKVNFLISFIFSPASSTLRFFSAVASSEAIRCRKKFQTKDFFQQVLEVKNSVQPNLCKFFCKIRTCVLNSTANRMDPWFVILLCRMQWTDEHHTLLLQEILATEPFKYKPRTQQRINLWNTVVAHLMM